jgi:hypothetical protein
LLLGHNRRASDLAVQRVPALRQFRGAEAKRLDSLRIENQSTGSPVSDEQAQFRIHFNLHGASHSCGEDYVGLGFRPGKQQIKPANAEIAAAEKINETYVGRVLRLTLLAPDVVEPILDGRQPPEITLAL